jgi:error-prone DNA polymerase
MIACRGRVQRGGDVVHVVAEHFIDMSGLLKTVGDRDEAPREDDRDDDAALKLDPHNRDNGIKIRTRDFR